MPISNVVVTSAVPVFKAGNECISKAKAASWVDEQTEDVAVLSSAFVFRQLFDTQGSSTFTYLLGCAATREAILIDPVLGMEERDLSVLKDLQLNLKYVINTHCHADHITSGSVIRKLLPGVRTVISEASGAKADWKIRDLDVVEFGKYHVQALSTPGHTDGCMTFVAHGPGNPLCAFTGDALLIRGCGRTDFQQGSSETLYDSVHQRIFTLPDRTQLFPGHDYKGRSVTSVAEERMHNPRLTQTKEEFVNTMANLNLPNPRLIDIAVPANMQCGVQD
jgi:sulfur dioxygenase